MKLWELEASLQGLRQFERPKIDLEQYPTGAHIAARMLHEAHMRFGDVEGRAVADLGCGCGILGIGAALLGADSVLGIDVDEDALQLAAANCADVGVQLDLVSALLPAHPLREACVDVVFMNPPFGTRRHGADMVFLSSALKVASVAVYSLHKSSTQEHIRSTAFKCPGVSTAEVLYQVRYNIPASYKFHKKKEVDIDVDLWRFGLTLKPS